MEALPTLEQLAAAEEEQLLGLWQGLGYYRRCRYLQKGAVYVLENGVPTDYSGWLKVPGVGPYTAAAISYICFDWPAAVVDGNVERVYARVTADAAMGSTLLKHAQKWASDHLYVKRPGDWNQAVMELGATVCTPKKPKCDACPIEDRCIARQSWRVEEFPQSLPKPVSKQMRFRVDIPFIDGRFGFEKIPPGGWWEGMWQFPTMRLESDSQDAVRETAADDWAEYVGEIRHVVTNHKVEFEIWLHRANAKSAPLEWRELSELEAIPLPAPQRKALKLALKALGLS
jgi:A/G-specific adenine glycosylase